MAYGTVRPPPPNAPPARPPSDPVLERAETMKRVDARKARTRAVFILVGVLLVLGTAGFIALTLSHGAAPRPELVFLQEGTLERTDAAKVLIVRDETTYASPAKGLLRPMATEGSRVPVGGLLAYITPKDRLATLQELQDLQQQIADLQRDLLLRGKGTAARAIYDGADQSLGTLAGLLRRSAAGADLSGVGRISASIGIAIDLRNDDLAAVDFQDAALDLLLARKSELESTLGLSSTSLDATRPGIVSYATDGLEATLRPDGLKTMTAQDVLDHLAAVPSRVDASREVEAGAVVLKTVDGPYQYFATVVPGVDASAFREGTTALVRFPLEGSLSVRALVSVSMNTEKGLLLVLRTDLLVERFADRRTEDVLLVQETARGLKVAVSSFVSYDRGSDRAVVKIVKDGYVRLAEVKVVAADRDEAVVAKLPDAEYAVEAHTVLVVDPGSIAEGAFIG